MDTPTQLSFLTTSAARVAIRELPAIEQPRERLRRYGPGALSSAELLAIALGLADLGQAETLLARFEGLNGLAQAPLAELAGRYRGIGPGKAHQLKAAFELGRRCMVALPTERLRIKSPADAANLLLADMGTLEQEELRTVILDTKNQVLKIHTVYVGSLNTVVVRIAELFREAIRLNAAALIVAHNHPSGDVSPSPEDVQVTRQLVEAGKLLSIDVLDHLVIGHSGRWLSLKERGLGF
jgi:DNA repair protein RadC